MAYINHAGPRNHTPPQLWITNKLKFPLTLHSNNLLCKKIIPFPAGTIGKTSKQNSHYLH